MLVKYSPVVFLVLLVAVNGKPSSRKIESTIPGGESVCSRDKAADVIFVYDAADIGTRKSDKIQDYIGSIVDQLIVDDDVFKVGVVSKNCHDGNKELGEYSDSDEFIKDLQNQDLLEFSHVIHKMRRHSFTLEHGGRPTARHIAVVFVDNKLEAQEKVLSEIEMAKLGGVQIFVVAIGDDFDLAEVKTMATSPNHVIEIPDYDDMNATSGRLVRILCAVADL